MTRPPDPSPMSGRAEQPQPDPGNLVELPVGAEPRSTPGARLADEPVEIAAWLDHVQGDRALDDRLGELARELAEGPPTRRAASHRRRWIVGGLVAAAALLTIGLVAYALHTPSSEPIAHALPVVVPDPQPSPDPLPIAVAEPEPHSPTPGPVAPARPAPPAPRLLDSSDPTTPLRVMAGVEVLLDGSLRIAGSQRAPRLSLVGSATIDVVPGSVDSLQVDSDAAMVQVLGTRFTVTEAATATTISVERGRVAVVCRAGQQASLTATQQVECTNANGLYLQAKRLHRQGAPPHELLPVVEAALNFPDFALHNQLVLMRTELEAGVAQAASARDDGQDSPSSP